MDTLVARPLQSLIDDVQRVRSRSELLAAPLSEADAQLQSMPDVSPTKWHLAHTTWFFETFILCVFLPHYKRVNEHYNYLFNSYYNGIGEQYPRHQRGLISRPSLAEVLQYRRAVDQQLYRLLEAESDNSAIRELVILGLHHEQQHQELMLTDIKHCLFHNPTYPAYQDDFIPTPRQADPLHWLRFDGQLVDIGCIKDGFSFDNERPVHSVYVNTFSLASRLVTNGEFAAFIDSGGYRNPQFWLADGWAWLQDNPQHRQPLYWIKQADQWLEYTLYGLRPMERHQPVMHVNYYEASAYASWLGLRLPTEFEWEHAVRTAAIKPSATRLEYSPLKQVFDTAWQWTSSHYSPYPGFAPFSGTAGEYNGKFMSNQYVLRGSSCVTPAGHSRVSYRNFFYPHQNWQFAGIRLAK